MSLKKSLRFSGTTVPLSAMREGAEVDVSDVGVLLHAKKEKVQEWLASCGYSAAVQEKLASYDGPTLLAQSKQTIIDVAGEDVGEKLFDAIHEQEHKDKAEAKKVATERAASKKKEQEIADLQEADKAYVQKFLEHHGFDPTLRNNLKAYDGPKLLEADSAELSALMGAKEAQRLQSLIK